MTLRRKSSLRRSRMGRGTKPIRKVNPERQAKRRQSYAKKLAAYKRSKTYKIVEARSGGRCERTKDVAWTHECMSFGPICFCEGRCPNPARIHNHKTYARFGGNELPEDVEHLCDECNALYESQHPTRQRNYSRRSPRRTAA